MKMSEAFPSKYLSEPDLQGNVHTVTMASCSLEEVGQEKKLLPVLMFQGKDKGLALNKTNAGVIARNYGDNTEDWIGKAIQLYPTTTEYKGERKPCIRVRMVSETSNAPADPPGIAGDGNDDIPF
jgi:hypothetical protein